MKNKILNGITGLASAGVFIFPCCMESKPVGILISLIGLGACFAWIFLFQKANNKFEDGNYSDLDN